MEPYIPETMKAAAIDRYGGPDVLQLHDLPVPRPGSKSVLIRLESAGIGVWDAEVRSGEFELGKGGFPKILGNDGSGTVVAVGKEVTRPKLGDRVYAYSFEGGFYAQYVAVKQDDVALAPPNLPTEEAGALGADGVTALIGLEDKLEIRRGESLLIFGASGGIGHIAVQLAKRLGVRVLAVASGQDGVELVGRLGADGAIDGHGQDVASDVREFASGGLDAALVLAGSKDLEQVLTAIRKGGRIAYPKGVEPEPKGPAGVKTIGYDGIPKPEVFKRLNALIVAGPFHVELAKTYELYEAARAHQDLGRHHLGKLALRIHAH